MRYPHIATRIYNTPLALDLEKARVIESVFRRYAFGDSEHPEAAARTDMPTQAQPDKPYGIHDGVAIIPVMGTLVQRSSGLDAMSGLSSYSEIGADINSAMNDEQVNSILLEIDSHGGEVAGLFELAGNLLAMRDKKPVYAIANEMAFSAAYALGSAASKLYVPKSGMVGSIGIVMMHVDQSQKDLKQGYQYTAIFAGAHKVDFSSHAPLSAAAKADAQESVDMLYDMFVEHVANARGMSAQVVRDTEAKIFPANEASALGLADGESTFSEVLAMAADAGKSAKVKKFYQGTRMASTNPDNRKELAMNEETQAAAGAIEANPQPVIDVPKLKSEARTEERTRIRGILTCEAANGRTKLAQYLALDSDTELTAAQAMLAAAAIESVEKPSAFAAVMAGVKNPNVGTDGDEDDDSEQAIANRIINAGTRPMKTVN